MHTAYIMYTHPSNGSSVVSFTDSIRWIIPVPDDSFRRRFAAH